MPTSLRLILDDYDVTEAVSLLAQYEPSPFDYAAHSLLADEISPDNCRLWDLKTNEKMDKDRFRQDLGRIEEAYQEVARRLGILPEGGPGDVKGPKTVQ